MIIASAQGERIIGALVSSDFTIFDSKDKNRKISP